MERRVTLHLAGRSASRAFLQQGEKHTLPATPTKMRHPHHVPSKRIRLLYLLVTSSLQFSKPAEELFLRGPVFQFLVVTTSHLPVALLPLLLSCKRGPSELGSQGRGDSLRTPGASILLRGTGTKRPMISVSGWKDVYVLHNM